jgi:aryl-alcohol dehydrogenase-like predicted oxidoreductase
MEKRKLGRSELEVAPFAFGGNVFGWTLDEPTSFQVLDAFVGEGFNFIDTADVYSRWKPGNQGGESETIIGNWLKKRGNRDKVIIATKVGGDMGQGHKSLQKDYILREVEASLRRLQTDYIDLYQSHWDDEALPVSEPLEAYDQLVREGKVRVIGASNFSQQRLADALSYSERHGLPRYESFQPPYNLYDRERFEKEYQQFCLEHQIGVITYYSLAAGFLTGKYHSEADLSERARAGTVKKYLNERGLRIIAALEEVAKDNETTPATIAMAWLVAQPGVTAPIASATSIEQLQQLVKGIKLQLSQEAISRLNEASRY